MKSSDNLTIGLVVATICLVTLIGAIGEFVLVYRGVELPDAIVALVSAALGSLVTLLTTTRTGFAPGK